jgi:hypothetical protein
MQDDYFAVVMMTKTGGKLRRYPVFDKEHTWLSCRAFEETAHKLPLDVVKVAASNLYSNCLYHDIDCPETIRKLAEEISTNIVRIDEEKDMPLEYHLTSEIKKMASEKVGNDQWGVITEDGERMYPLNTEENVKSAIGYFEKKAYRILPEYRYQFAKNICKHAGQYKLEVPTSISVYNNDRGNNTTANICSRLALTKTAEEKKFITKLSKIHKSLDVDTLISYLIDFDKTAGLDKYWDKHIKNPYISVLEKVAVSDWSDGDLSAEPKPEDIEHYSQQYAATDLPGFLPDDIINSFIKNPLETYSQMPEIQKEIIEKGVRGKL